jgi:hypothetical protein
MAAHVADEIDADAPLHEAPLPVAAFDAIDGLPSAWRNDRRSNAW